LEMIIIVAIDPKGIAIASIISLILTKFYPIHFANNIPLILL